MADKSWKIHKFGGSSLSDADCFRRVASILAGRPDDALGIVVSAMGGMTDDLLRLCALAERDDKGFVVELQQIGKRYADAARALIESAERVSLLDQWSEDAVQIQETLTKIARVKSAPIRQRDFIAGFGEIWSASSPHHLHAAPAAIILCKKDTTQRFSAAMISRFVQHNIRLIGGR